MPLPGASCSEAPDRPGGDGGEVSVAPASLKGRNGILGCRAFQSGCSRDYAQEMLKFFRCCLLSKFLWEECIRLHPQEKSP